MMIKRSPFSSNKKSIILIWSLVIFYGACDNRKTSLSTVEMDQGFEDVRAGEEVDEQSSGEQSSGEQSSGEQSSGEQGSGEQEVGGFESVQAGESGIDERAGEQFDGNDPNDLNCEPPRDDAERLVALSFPYSETLGVDGLSIQIYRFENRQLVPWGRRLELVNKTSALSFSKDGWWLIALGEQGSLTAIDLRGDLPVIASHVDLVSGDYSILEQGNKDRHFDVINSNSNEFSGIYSFSLNCDGSFDLAEQFYYLRLIQGFKRAHTVANQAFVFGGQALFEPIDLIDVRWLSSETSEGETMWGEMENLDVFEDFIDAINLGLSPFDDWLTVVNGSPFTEEGGQVRFIEVQTDPPSLREAFLFEGFSDVRGAWYLPQGDTMMITQLEANAVQFFILKEEEWRVGQRLEGIGLANQCALLTPSEQTDGLYALIPSVSPTGGSGVSLLNILDGENVMSLPTIPLGDGYSNIPKAIATWPLIEN